MVIVCMFRRQLLNVSSNSRAGGVSRGYWFAAQNQTMGDVASCILWVSGETPCLKGCSGREKGQMLTVQMSWRSRDLEQKNRKILLLSQPQVV